MAHLITAETFYQNMTATVRATVAGDRLLLVGPLRVGALVTVLARLIDGY